MRIIGHVKVSAALATTSFLLGMYMGYDYTTVVTLSVALAIGSVGPDFTELGIVEHRTYTHYPPFYAVIIFCAWHAFEKKYINEVGLMALTGYSIGAITHILCDWPYYRGIPLFLPKQRIKSFGLTFKVSTDRRLEFLVILGVFVLGGYLALQH